MRALVLSTLILTSSCACRDQRLEPVPAFLRVEPTQVDFGRLVVGQAEARVVTVINSGRAPMEGTWALTGEGFRADDGIPTRALVGSTPLTVVCAPDHLGVFDGALKITFAGFEPIVVPLACEAIEAPACAPSGPCKTSSWDVVAGRCVEANVTDDEPCTTGDACLLDARCHAGRCEGRLRDCNDGEPCTADTCDPLLGCRHLENVACPAGPCEVGQCVRGQGCVTMPAEDGAPCGQRRSCTEADVCIAGQCVQRDPPDGFVCAAAGPCGDQDGRCVNDVCVPGGAARLRSTWTAGTPLPDGGPSDSWSDVFTTRDGRTVLGSYFFTQPRIDARQGMPITLAQSARRCISWLGWVVCGDLPAIASSPITAIDPATGSTVWTFSGAAALIPEFTAPNAQFFTARLAVMNENELLVLYESRTLSPEGVDPRCRTYAMIVLDRQGQPLRSLFLTHPSFMTCDHPHSYGVATDADSNIYLAFAPSGFDNPATALTGTMVFSYTPSLQLRWQAFDPLLIGGDIAVANGLLFHERGTDVLDTRTGTVALRLPLPFGRGVVGEGFVVPASEGQTTLAAWGADGGARWSAGLTQASSSAPLNIASWASPWGSRDVVLRFTGDGRQQWLEAVELRTGASAFACQVDLEDTVRMASLTPGGLTLMSPVFSTADPCLICDPRYARTPNRFDWFALPGLSPSTVAWPGGWGNETHSHHEGR